MQSLWNDDEAAQYAGSLGQRVYTSRLLGRDHALVLHGGGNTSVKISERNLFGEEEDILYVKGSGWDLASIEAAGFAPVRLKVAQRLANLPRLSDEQMVQELRSAMRNPAAPTPSVETLLHALLPYTFVDHTHADALLAISNTADGPARVCESYGDTVVVIPYVMPGFDLARVVAERFSNEAGPNTIGLVLLHHGIFSFGDSARQAYERMIQLVSRAEDYLGSHGARGVTSRSPTVKPTRTFPRIDMADLRKSVSDAAGGPMILASHAGLDEMEFVRRGDLGTISQEGPATPDHVIRTKRIPQIGRDVRAFQQQYERYFTDHSGGSTSPLQMLDPAPRVILDADFGVVTVGKTAQAASIAHDVYSHTIDIVLQATALGGYRALGAADIFAVEYWDLEQAKLRRSGATSPFAGEIALVTGAASGIGKATAEAFLRRGAAVIGLDINSAICEAFAGRVDFLGVQGDVTRSEDLETALNHAAEAFGGLDMLVLNAGMFGASRRIEALSMAEWRRLMQLNLDASVALLSAAYPLLKRAPRGGRVVVIGSKNVPAPGPGAAAYSASKAALNQVARVAALEWGADGIRVNVVHPNAVFDTGIWTDEVLQARAANYGMTIEQYRKNNVLGVEITSRDVGEMVAEMCGPLFARTTGAQVPIDGGNERVI